MTAVASRRRQSLPTSGSNDEGTIPAHVPQDQAIHSEIRLAQMGQGAPSRQQGLARGSAVRLRPKSAAVPFVQLQNKHAGQADVIEGISHGVNGVHVHDKNAIPHDSIKKSKRHKKKLKKHSAYNEIEED